MSRKNGRGPASRFVGSALQRSRMNAVAQELPRVPFQLDRLIVLGAVFEIQLKNGAEIAGDPHTGSFLAAKNEYPILDLGIAFDHPIRRGCTIDEYRISLALEQDQRDGGRGHHDDQEQNRDKDDADLVHGMASCWKGGERGMAPQRHGSRPRQEDKKGGGLGYFSRAETKPDTMSLLLSFVL